MLGSGCTGSTNTVVPEVVTDKGDKRVVTGKSWRKPGKQFFITIGFKHSVWSDTREQLVYNLRFDWAVEIVSYALGLETSDKSVLKINVLLRLFFNY